MLTRLSHTPAMVILMALLLLADISKAQDCTPTSEVNFETKSDITLKMDASCPNGSVKLTIIQAVAKKEDISVLLKGKNGDTRITDFTLKDKVLTLEKTAVPEAGDFKYLLTWSSKNVNVIVTRGTTGSTTTSQTHNHEPIDALKTMRTNLYKIPSKKPIQCSPEESETRHITYNPCGNCGDDGAYKGNVFKMTPAGKNTGSKMYAKVGEPLTFDVVGVNPFRYKVSITKSDTNYNESDALLLDSYLRSLMGSSGISASADTKATDTKATRQSIIDAIMDVGADIDEYMASMRAQDCIDQYQLQTDRDAIRKNVESNFQERFGKSYQNALKSILPIMTSDGDTAAIRSAIAIYRRLLNFSFTYRYIIPEVQNKDEVIYHISILPIDSSVSYDIRMNNEPIHIPIRGGFKIDGSIGVFYSSLVSQSYYARPDSFTSYGTSGRDTLVHRGNRVLPTRSRFNSEFGAMVLVHFYSRLSRNVNVGGVAGVGITFASKPDPRGMLGGSIMFGKSNRLAISGGAVFGPVQVLKAQYAAPGLYTDSSGFTETQIKVGGFLSLSYNFSFSGPKKSTQTAGAQ